MFKYEKAGRLLRRLAKSLTLSLTCLQLISAPVLANGMQAVRPNDPWFPQEWHLGAMHAPEAWGSSTGNRNIGLITDEQFTLPHGAFNQDMPRANVRTIGNPAGLASWENRTHSGDGEKLATAGFAQFNNNFATAGLAPDARLTIYEILQHHPFHPTAQDFQNQDQILADAIIAMRRQNPHIKIICVCIRPMYQATDTQGGGTATERPSNASLYRQFHRAAQDFHDAGGLVFLNAGDHVLAEIDHNPGFDPNPQLPYLQVVRGLNRNLSWSDRYDFGNSISFCAPAEGILCTDQLGHIQTGNGSKYATVLCAGVAALIWGSKPALANTQVLSIMQRTANKFGLSRWTTAYGHGMPDACNAVEAARAAVPLRERILLPKDLSGIKKGASTGLPRF